VLRVLEDDDRDSRAALAFVERVDLEECVQIAVRALPSRCPLFTSTFRSFVASTLRSFLPPSFSHPADALSRTSRSTRSFARATRAPSSSTSRAPTPKSARSNHSLLLTPSLSRALAARADVPLPSVSAPLARETVAALVHVTASSPMWFGRRDILACRDHRLTVQITR
jgi:hypothetical protein